MVEFGTLFFTLLFGILPLSVGALALYWTVRLAVRHGIEDRDRRASQRAAATYQAGHHL